MTDQIWELQRIFLNAGRENSTSSVQRKSKKPQVLNSNFPAIAGENESRLIDGGITAGFFLWHWRRMKKTARFRNRRFATNRPVRSGPKGTDMSDKKIKSQDVKTIVNDELPDAALDMVSGGYPARPSMKEIVKGSGFGR